MKLTQEQIKIEAENFMKGLDLPQNADKQLIFDAFRNGMSMALMLVNEQQQQWIEKACEWLKENVITPYTDIEMVKDILDNFKQAMEEKL